MLSAYPSEDAATDMPEPANQLLATRFTDEVIPHTAYLLGHAIGLTHQRSDAEDLVQETMIKAYVSFATFREGSNVKSWLYRIMANTWVDRHRSSLRRPAEQLLGDLTDPQMASQAHVAGSLPSAESEALKSVPGEAEVALSELPPTCVRSSTTPTCRAIAIPRLPRCSKSRSAQWDRASFEVAANCVPN